ncbi:MAG: leucyl/phenylalanyl-tRNA--protein transferase [Bradymonadia bacterium]|jgi:leucyl/phenylalanyl-tRNA--protein transferase
MPIYALTDEIEFPDPRNAEEHGIVAVGGDLTVERLLLAYTMGIFPWPIKGLPLTWFSPDPRMVLDLSQLRVSRSLRRSLRRGWTVTLDRAFELVMEACSNIPRGEEEGTWITPEMTHAYAELHRRGFAHSVEVWDVEGQLIGGAYGISLGNMFCGESMFHRETDASKVAFVTLARQLEAWGFEFLDCQLHTDHLESLGACEISRDDYLGRLDASLGQPTRPGPWTLDAPT